jgi:Zn-dependent peptidase ImmA (M78 family)
MLRADNMNATQEVKYSSPEASNLSRSDVWKLAEKVAQDLKVSPGASLVPYVAKLGGKIEMRDIDDLQESGAIVIRSDRDFTIFLPFHTGAKRDRFTIGHELGHYFLHYKLLAVQGRAPNLPMKVSRYGSDRTETEANWFAAAFLMPADAFRKSYSENNGDLIAAANEFDVSRAAAEVRAASLNLSPRMLPTEGFPFE